MRDFVANKFKTRRGWLEIYSQIYFSPSPITQDDSVGQIVAKLKDKGMYDNSVIVFISDNGGLASQSSNYPLRGQKISLLEVTLFFQLQKYFSPLPSPSPKKITVESY